MAWLNHEAHWAHRMVLKILSDAWKVNQRVDSQAGQQVFVADSRKLQKLWSVEHAPRQNDFL